MSSRMSALVLTLYLAGMVVIVLVAHLLFGFYRRSLSDALALSHLLPASPVAGARSPGVRRTYNPALLAKAHQELKQLRETFETTSTALRQRTKLLNEARAQCRALETELDQTLTLVYQLITEEAEGGLKLGTTTRPDQASSVRLELEEELKRLRSELGKTDVLEQEQAEQVEELKTELMWAELEMALIQFEAKQQIGTLLEERVAIESAATEVLIRAGAAAVPPMINLLADKSADVRSWAAFVLSKIGKDAKEAAPALQRLLSDPVEDVRMQARQALSAIETPGEP